MNTNMVLKGLGYERCEEVLDNEQGLILVYTFREKQNHKADRI